LIILLLQVEAEEEAVLHLKNALVEAAEVAVCVPLLVLQ
jgi:hypothetical protein